MQRGRRLFYDMTNGKIHFDTGEAQGDVLPHEEIGSSTSLRYLDLPFGQDAEMFSRVKTYHVDHDTKTVVFDELYPEEQSKDEIIADLQAQLEIMTVERDSLAAQVGGVT